MLENAREQARERAAAETDRQASALKNELGERAWDALEAVFPQQAKLRRRRQRLRALAVGVVVGLWARTAIRWWLGDR